MKSFKNLAELLRVVVKDPVDVIMLTAWLLLVVYLYIMSFKIDDIDSEFLSKVFDRAWAGAGFFWLYNFVSVLRIAWHKLRIKNLENEQSKH